jgi:hypothetical protein
MKHVFSLLARAKVFLACIKLPCLLPYLQGLTPHPVMKPPFVAAAGTGTSSRGIQQIFPLQIMEQSQMVKGSGRSFDMRCHAVTDRLETGDVTKIGHTAYSSDGLASGTLFRILYFNICQLPTKIQPQKMNTRQKDLVNYVLVVLYMQPYITPHVIS